jgi:hypothetical protein
MQRIRSPQKRVDSLLSVESLIKGRILMWRYFSGLGAAMKTFNRLGLAIVCAAALSAMLPASSRADTIYTYTGNGFTSAISPYTLTDSVSGWIDLSAPLGNSVGPLTITPVAFSFSDGVQTITNNDVISPPSFFDGIITNSSGDIVAWDILVQSGAGGIIEIQDVGIGTQRDLAGVLGVGGFNVDASVAKPGSWVVATTPIPAALPLFATGLGALGLLGWRRKRKAAALAA